MFKYPRILSSMTLFCLLSTGCVGVIEGEEEQEQTQADPLAAIVQSRYIVVLNDSVEVSALTVPMGVQTVAELSGSLNGFIFEGPQELADEIARRPEVAFVQPDQIIYAELPSTSQDVPDWCQFLPEHEMCQDETPDPEPDPDPDPEMPSWCQYLPNHPMCDGSGEPEPKPEPDKQVTPPGVVRVGGSGGYGDHTAWVIDTGIDMNNPDLNVDAARSKSFLDMDDSPQDENGHGTHVAGTIGALDNDIGVIGVAPGVPLVALRMLDADGRGTTVGTLMAVEYVAQHAKAGDVVNMSIGGRGFDEAVDTALKNVAAMGIRVAIAAGNEGEDASDFSPASTNADNIYTVSAIGTDDCLTSFSNYGAPVDIAAPGDGILSTQLGGGTNTLSGTSMASPHVAGLLLGGGLSTDGPICGDKDDMIDQVAHR